MTILFLPASPSANENRLGSGFLGRVASKLLLGIGLSRTLGSADGRDTLDSELTEVGTVAVLGSLVGDRLVTPERRISIIQRFTTAVWPRRRVVLLAAGPGATVLRLHNASLGLGADRGLLGDDGESLLGTNNTDGLTATS